MARAFLSYAKLNLYLAVGGVRPDGYHEIDSVLQSVSLADRLVFETDPGGTLEVTTEAPGVPSGPLNLAWRALELLRERTGARAGMRLRIEKRVPARAGLGGGSSNAACALGAANLIWGLGLAPERLEELGAEIGSDVPFFVRGGTQRCRERGERCERLADLPGTLWAVVVPAWGQSTAEVYRGFAPGLTQNDECISMALGQIAKRDLEGLARATFNDLESAAQRARPENAQVRSFLVSLGLSGVALAGSGSAWFGSCPSTEVGERVRAEAGDRGWRAFLVGPVKEGWAETMD